MRGTYATRVKASLVSGDSIAVWIARESKGSFQQPASPLPQCWRPACWRRDWNRSRSYTTPAKCFHDGHFRQKRYRKPLGKTIRDDYLQGWPVRDKLTRKVDFPWRKTIKECFLTVVAIRREFPHRFFNFHQESVSLSVTAPSGKIQTIPVVSSSTIRKGQNFPVSYDTVRDDSSFPCQSTTVRETLFLLLSMIAHWTIQIID